MYYFENVLDENQYEYVTNKTLYGNRWKFDGTSTSFNPVKFWYMELIDDPFFTENFLKRIELLSRKKYELLRVYANGQTYGLCGDLHKDIDTEYSPELYHTFLYYVNPVWYVNWGGATHVVTDEDTVDTVFPSKNTGCLFQSTLNHIGMEPTRHCTELRVTVAFKLKEIL
jgi:hypothetical protein